MLDRNKNKKSSLSDFIRYQNDKMNGEERNAFERELQKDHFAADAAEGFSEMAAEKAGNDLTELRRSLRRRTGKGSYSLFYRIAAAAAVAIVVIISSLFIVTRHEKQPVTLSQNISPEIKSPVAVNAPEESEISQVKPSDRKHVISSPQPAKAAQQTEKKEVNEERITEFPEPEIKDSAITVPGFEIMADKAAANPVPAEGKMMKSVPAAGVASKGKSEPERDYKPPQPVTGRDTFNLFIENNIHNPEPGKPMQQVVTLSFLV